MTYEPKINSRTVQGGGTGLERGKETEQPTATGIKSEIPKGVVDQQ